jgi:hypothetical protein
VTRGEPHDVRSIRPRCRFLPLDAGLPDRDADASALPPWACAHEVAAAIDACGSEDRAKDASYPEREMQEASPDGGMRFLKRMPTTFPSSAILRTPAVIGATAGWGGAPQPTCQTDQGSRLGDAPRRAPSSRKPGCLRPPRSRKLSERITPPALPRRPLAHAARTPSPGVGRTC